MIRRRPKKTEFTQVQNAMLLNPRLSLKAKGLLTIMMSRPEDWTFYMSWLEAQSTDGREAHRSAMQELIGAGYVERKKINGEAGKIEWEYIVDDIPFATIDGFSVYGSTVYGKPAATNTDYTNTNSKDAGASRAASQPQDVSSDESPEGEAQGSADTLSSGPAVDLTPPPVARPPLPVRWGSHQGYENDGIRELAEYAEKLAHYISGKVDDYGQSGVEIQAIQDKYRWWTANGVAAFMDELAEYAKAKGVEVPEDFADPDFTSGPSAHPEPQTPLPEAPVVSTGHSLLDRVAQLRASGQAETDAMKQAKQSKDREHRKHWAIRSSIENTAEQAVFDMTGDKGYRFMLRLIKDTRTSADTILGWFKRRPFLAEVVSKLDDARYAVHLQAGMDKARQHRSGWQASPVPWFFESLVAEVPQEQRKAEPNGNSRFEYSTRISAAMSAAEIEEIIMEFHERGQLETRRKRDADGRMVMGEDGKPIHNSPEEELAAVLEERGLSSTKGSEE